MKLLNTARKLSFQFKLMLFLCLFSIGLVSLVSYVNYRWHSEQMIEQTASQTQQIIEQLGTNINNYIDELYRLTLSPYYYDDIMGELVSLPSTTEERLNKKRKIESFLSSVMTLPRNEILRVYILTDNEIYSYTRTPYEMEDYDVYQDTDWYKQALQSKTPIYIPIHSEKAFGNKETSILSVARRIRSKEDNKQVLGVVKVDTDYSVIKSLCEKVEFEHRGALYIITNDNHIVYSKNKLPALDSQELIPFAVQSNATGNIIKAADGNRYILNTISLNEAGMKIIALNSYQDIILSTLKSITTTFLLVILCLIAALAGLFIFLRKFFTPLFSIVETMKVVQTGDLSVQVPLINDDEIGYLAKSFNRMLQNLNSVINRNTALVTQVYEMQYLHKSSQYEALCNQIKPHFIHNTLNTISLLIKCNEYEKAIDSIENLSLFLRGVMNVDKDIFLSTELQLVRAYLQIQQIRYGEKLSFSIEIDKKLLQTQIPALTIQPLVENCVKHSCEETRTPMHIRIHASRNNNILLITVSDNGLGIAPDKLEELRQNFASDNDARDNHQTIDNSIGLLNVQRRLKIKFGTSSQIFLNSILGEGTTITVSIPLDGKEEKDFV